MPSSATTTMCDLCQPGGVTCSCPATHLGRLQYGKFENWVFQDFGNCYKDLMITQGVFSEKTGCQVFCRMCLLVTGRHTYGSSVQNLLTN